MSEQDCTQATMLQRPAANDKEAWKVYWMAQDQPWRTQPEIDAERQKYLDERRSITPDIKQGTYPFSGIKLSRADVEWLLATHENGRGPVDWSDKNQRIRKGLDLRGAILRGVNLSALPLACLRGGLSQEELRFVSIERREASMVAAAIHFEGENTDSILFDYRFLSYPHDESLCDTHLEGAELSGAFLTGATMFGTFLIEAQLYKAHLEETDLRQADLEEANLDSAYLMKAHLDNAHLTKAKLLQAFMDGAWLPETDLEGADLYKVTLKKAHMYKACLKGVRLYNASLKLAELREAHLEEADLTKASLEEANLVGAHLEDANLEYAHLEGADLLGAHLEGARCCRAFFDAATRLNGVILSNENHGSASLAEVSWGGVNLTVVNWSPVKLLGDEYIAQQSKDKDGKEKDGETQISEYQRAVRANRQLAVALQAQGMDDEASHYGYRGQRCKQRLLLLRVLQGLAERPKLRWIVHKPTKPSGYLYLLSSAMVLVSTALLFLYVFINVPRMISAVGIFGYIMYGLMAFTFLFVLSIVAYYLIIYQLKVRLVIIFLFISLLYLTLLFFALFFLIYIVASPHLLSLLFGMLLLVLLFGSLLMSPTTPEVEKSGLDPYRAFLYGQDETVRLRWKNTIKFFQKVYSSLRPFLNLQTDYGRYIFSLFLDFIAGYGYKPGRSLFWYFVVVFGFTVAYHLFGKNISLIEAFVLSITSFHGRGFFPGLGNETSLYNPLGVLAAIEAVIGLIIEISFIATFTQRFFGK